VFQLKAHRDRSAERENSGTVRLGNRNGQNKTLEEEKALRGKA
jgi:hypothetical protein